MKNLFAHLFSSRSLAHRKTRKYSTEQTTNKKHT